MTGVGEEGLSPVGGDGTTGGDGPTGRDGTIGPGPRAYRLSDAERDVAIGVLSDAFSRGRLDATEFADRMAQASEARFATDLDPIFVDLPASAPLAAIIGRDVPSPGTPTPRPWAPPRPRGYVMPLIPIALVLLVILTHAWILIPIAFVVAGRRRRYAPWQGGHPRAARGSWGHCQGR